MWSPAGAGPTTLPWGQTSLISHIKDDHTGDPKMGRSQRSSWPVPPQLGRERQREAGPALRTRALLGLLAGGGPGLEGALPGTAQEITDTVPSRRLQAGRRDPELRCLCLLSQGHRARLRGEVQGAEQRDFPLDYSWGPR